MRSIISTTVADLDANPNHTFIYVEQYVSFSSFIIYANLLLLGFLPLTNILRAYFWRWWTDGNVTDAQRTAFRRVYDRGQFEFVIGMLIASFSYSDIIFFSFFDSFGSSFNL